MGRSEIIDNSAYTEDCFLANEVHAENGRLYSGQAYALEAAIASQVSLMMNIDKFPWQDVKLST